MWTTIMDFAKSMTVPIALLLIAAALVFMGFSAMLTSPVGLIVMAAIAAGVLYWYWTREPTPPAT